MFVVFFQGSPQKKDGYVPDDSKKLTRLLRRLGANPDVLEVVVGVEVKKITEDAKSWIQSFGVIDGGLELMRYAWPSLDHKFSVRRNDTELLGDDGTTEIIRATIGTQEIFCGGIRWT